MLRLPVGDPSAGRNLRDWWLLPPEPLKDAHSAAFPSALPSRCIRVGRPRHDHRAVLGGILWVLRNRAPWRDPPERSGSSSTAYKRYRLWSDTGLWERLLRALRSATDEAAAGVSL